MRVRKLLLLGLILGLVACTKQAPALGGTGNSESALISGRAIDADKGEPLANATVTISTDETTTDDDKTTTTDDDGYFEVQGESGKTTVVTVQDSDHAKAVREVYASTNTTYVEVSSKEVAKDETLNAASGGTVKLGNERTGEMTVHVPEDALETRDGEKYTGDIKILIATVQPDKASDVAAFPGTFDGTTTAGDPGTIETRTAALLRILTADDEELVVSQGTAIEMFMPVRPSLSRQQVPFWRLDDGKADWTQFDFPAVRDVDPITSLPALRSAVRKLTWWNAGEPIALSKVTGCLERGEGDAEGALSGIQVVATGLGYGYRAEHFTNADGCFELNVKALRPVAIFAQTRGKRTRPIRVIAPRAGQSAEIDMVALETRTDDCPGAMVECGGECVDLLSNDEHCGECNNTCDAEPISSEYPSIAPVHCVFQAAGATCGCGINEEACNGGCANTDTDASNCGACGTTCGIDQECVDAECVTITCPAQQRVCNGVCIAMDAPCGSVGVSCNMGMLACPDLSTTPSGEAGFSSCCAPDQSCGVQSDAQLFYAQCASTFHDVPATAGCPGEDVLAFGTLGQGCCRPDAQCGLIIEGREELGCVLRHDLSSDFQAIPCGGGSGEDAGVGGSGGASADGGVAGTGGSAGGPADAGTAGAGGFGGGAGGGGFGGGAGMMATDAGL